MRTIPLVTSWFVQPAIFSILLAAAACGSGAVDTDGSDAADDAELTVRTCGARERVVSCGPFTQWMVVKLSCDFNVGTQCAWTDARGWQHHWGVREVLVVLDGGKAWVLDNQIDQVIDADRIRHYRPYYSINASAYWLHR